MKFGARNNYMGIISAMHKCPINTEIKLNAKGGGKIVAIITTNSAQHLGLVSIADDRC